MKRQIIDNQYVDMNSFSNRPKAKKSSKAKKATIIVVCVLIALILAIGIAAYFYTNSMLNNIEKVDVGEDLGIASEAEATYSNDVTNIALLGLDTRSEDYSGRADTIIILTLDKKHNKIKLTSIARDSYVQIDGRGKDKINHAWAFGKAPLMIKTINSNFNLNIKDFIAVNFYEFAEVIDYLGGVSVSIESNEIDVTNKYIRELNNLGMSGEPISSTGTQLLNGCQALAYSRNRYTDSDLGRNKRQTEVIDGIYKRAKETLSPSQYPEFISLILKKSSTSLSNTDILGHVAWLTTSSPTTENLGIPNAECNSSGQTIGGVWYFVYDLNIATKQIESFINEG